MTEIIDELKRSPYVQIDETPFPVNGKRGYMWLVRTGRAMFVMATTTRSSEVIPTFFGALIGKYATTDRYAAYPKFVKMQRCWSHELLQAEGLAIKGGATDKQIDQLKDNISTS